MSSVSTTKQLSSISSNKSFHIVLSILLKRHLEANRAPFEAIVFEVRVFIVTITGTFLPKHVSIQILATYWDYIISHQKYPRVEGIGGEFTV